MLPLFVKYQTRAGNHYVYDVRSNQILRVGNVVYEVLDDYRLLTTDEICEKHAALGKQTVREALAELDKVQARGVLSDHAPQISEKVSGICCEKTPEPFRNFLQHRRRLLTIELTHRCNLECEYCCFGKHYDQTRQPSTAAISLDTATQAVSKFIAHKPTNGCIGFYGGEPLLEFELIKEIVAFAESFAEQCGVDIGFTMTTNGTLLSDEKIHYLVAHEVSVMISLDGDRESHDRYRVFKRKRHQEEPRGSFDIILRNMERFVELYPKYTRRGIVLTLTATADLSELETFIQQWRPLFPAFVSNAVSPVASRLAGERHGYSIKVGQCRAAECGDVSCGRMLPGNEMRGEIPAFDNWSTALSLRRRLDRFVSKLVQTRDAPSANAVCEEFPICRNMFSNALRPLHRRRILAGAEARPVARLSCLPGSTRTYCSLQGVLFPCEKTEFGQLFEIGGATVDVDADKVCGPLLETIRLGCDCGNCVLNKLCQLCPAHVKESEEFPGCPDLFELQTTCRGLASESRLVSRLREYTEIMEGNPEVLDWLFEDHSEQRDDWLNDLKPLVAKREDVELLVEELEEFV